MSNHLTIPALSFLHKSGFHKHVSGKVLAASSNLHSTQDTQAMASTNHHFFRPHNTDSLKPHVLPAPSPSLPSQGFVQYTARIPADIHPGQLRNFYNHAGIHSRSICISCSNNMRTAFAHNEKIEITTPSFRPIPAYARDSSSGNNDKSKFHFLFDTPSSN